MADRSAPSLRGTIDLDIWSCSRGHENDYWINTQGYRCCRVCNRQRQAKNRARDLEGARERGRAYHAKTAERRRELDRARYQRRREQQLTYKRFQRYELTQEQFENLKIAQDSKCAICQDVLVFGKRFGAAVDHCHLTGQVRGLLCANCNSGIAHLRDDPEVVRKALAYLERGNTHE